MRLICSSGKDLM